MDSVHNPRVTDCCAIGGPVRRGYGGAMGQGAHDDRTVILRGSHDDARLQDAVAAAGWTVLTPGNGGAATILVDARSDAEGMLGWMDASGGIPLLVIVARADVGLLDAFRARGATHYLVEPADAGEIVQALRFAAPRPDAPPVRAERRGEPGDDRDEGEARRWLDARIADGRAVGVVLASLSRLDLVNAAYGRPMGDTLIAAAGRRIAATARSLVEEEPPVLRIGAADYALMVDDASADRIAALAARLGEALARPFVVEGKTAALGSRLGVALADPGDDAAALLRRAGDALLRARASDGATMHVADAVGASSLDTLAVDLHHAISLGEIDILFQPQVEIASGRIVGVEALARWDHGTLGALGADALFAAAERADLGIALSEHIQRLVLDRAARWPQALGALRVSVNLTAADVARPGYAALFLERLDASGFPRGRLTVEITESGLMADLAAASAFLSALRGAGCRVAIDDFGTGYSSLAYLKTLPLDYLKIDRALTRDIGGSSRDRVVVGGVITMARSLGLGVIAEGVETPDQRALLAAAGCDLYQGFLTAGPLDEAALLTMIEGE